jgi:ferritin
MISKKLEKALNEQMNFEFYSAYIYLSMSAWFSSQNLSGMAHWMNIQSQEEVFHAMKFFNYVNDRGGRVTLKEIKQPQTEWTSPADAFRGAYEHEQMVTARISDLIDVALKEKDHVTNSLLQWFINEQIEEEANAKTFSDQLGMMGDSKDFVFMLDREMAQRQLNLPTQAQ